ncbi:MAG: adenylate/guanylate cyclase domain-containing protein, partial [Anaerolineae bacterium]
MKPQDRADEIASLEQAIAALEAQRSTLGDAAVDASVTTLREKIRALARHGGPPLQDAPAPPSRRERKTVTIVMADVQGSTDLAARMETSAKPGTVLVAESTYRLTADQFRWQPLGPIAVKGIQQPVLAYRP